MASKKTKVAMEIGAGLLAAAGAGYYFYASAHAKRHRSAASSWAKGLKHDVMKEVKNMKRADEKGIKRAIDMASNMYANVKNVNKAELGAAVKELKKNWKTLSQEAKGAGNMASKARKTLMKKVARSGKKAVSTAKKTGKGMAKGTKTAVKKGASLKK